MTHRVVERARSHLLGGGPESDPRFTLANERTFLAWIRTALAIVATAVATDTLMVAEWPTSARKAVVVVLLLAGCAISAGAGLRWLRVERALRREEPLPLSPLAPLLSAAVLLSAGAALGLTAWWTR